MQYEELPESQRPFAGREDVRDAGREVFREDDTPVERAARKYLRSRSRRRRMEFELGAGDAIFQRLVELIRARKYAKLAEIDIKGRKDIDAVLPTAARFTLDQVTSDDIH